MIGLKLCNPHANRPTLEICKSLYFVVKIEIHYYFRETSACEANVTVLHSSCKKN